jgi:multiple sugar transport system substrate-binding protein
MTRFSSSFIRFGRAKLSALFSVSVAIGLFCLAGCSHRNGGESEVVFWAFGAEGEHVARLMPEFERRNPGIHVRVQMIPWNAAHEKLLTAFAGNSLPDMCQLGNTWIPEFSMLNSLEDLDTLVAHSTALQGSDYFSGIWETNVILSHLYGIPWYVDTRVLFYRSDLAADVGFSRPPASWEEWFDLCARLKKRDPEDFAIFLPTNIEWAPPVILGLQKNSPLLKDDNTLGDFSGPEFVSAMHTFVDFFRRGWAPIKTTQIVSVYQSFSEAYFAMYITGPWNIGEFRRRLPPSKRESWMTAPLPGPNGGVGVSLAGGSSLVMFRSSARKQEVWKVIEFLSEKEQQLELYRLTGDLPARVEAWDDTALAKNRYASAFFIQLKHVVPTPKIPEWEQIAQKVREYSELISTEQYTVEDGMARLDREVNLILEKRRWLLRGQ